MKKYPKRTNKLYKEIDLINIHKCNLECEMDIYQVDNTLYINTNELINGKCSNYDKLKRGLVKLFTYEKDNPRTTMNELLHSNEIILPSEFNVYINFPIKNSSTFSIKLDKGPTLAEFIDILKKIYDHIYTVEYETCTPVQYTFIERCKDCGINYIQESLNNKDKITGEDCIICMENDCKESVVLDCGHTMHIECLNEWIAQENNTCPICRECINKCNECDGKLTIEKEFVNKVIPREHRINNLRNQTDGIFGVYGFDLEDMFVNRIFYCKNSNKIYLIF